MPAAAVLYMHLFERQNIDRCKCLNVFNTQNNQLTIKKQTK